MSEKTSVLLSDVTIKGNVIEKEKLMTDAKIEGDVSAEVLQTFEGSNIKGDINSSNTSVGGVLKGNIKSDKIRIKSTADVEGNLNQKNLSIEDGAKLKIKDVLRKILSNPNVCSKEWIWQQYDHTVMGDTIQKPGGDAGVIRVHGTKKAVAASVDSSASYCYSHPLTGGKQVVCESWRYLISVGAKPIAITNLSLIHI